MSFQVTKLHDAIFTKSTKTHKNFVVQARAGCGKTSTCLETIRRLPRSETVSYVSFGAKNIKDVAEKLRGLGRPVVAKTMHSHGAAALTRKFGKRPADEKYKIKRIINERLSDAEARAFGPAVVRLADKMRAVGDCTREIAERFEITPPTDKEGVFLWDRLIEITKKVVHASVAQCADTVRKDGSKRAGTMDFGDMIYAAFHIASAHFEKFDNVFVDEVQDFNPLQRAITRCLIAPGGRVIAFGDDRQAIYAFNGADCNAFALFVKEFACDTLPLNVTYRCGKAIVREAQQYVPDFEAGANNPEGVVRRCSLNDFRNKEVLGGGDMVICRSNAPVVAAAFALIKRGIPAIVLGRDNSDGLLRIVDQLMATDVEDLLARLVIWSDREVKRARKATKNEDAADEVVETILDKVAVIQAVCEGAADVDAVCEKINMVFSDAGNANVVTLCSVHKAKGAEADRVFILKPDQLPSPKAKTADAQLQEENLAYVAITRAKSELVYVDG